MAGVGLNGLKVIVVGANPSGLALIKYLVHCGAQATLVQANATESVQEFVKENSDLTKFHFEYGENNPKIFEETDLVIVARGVQLDLKCLEAARTNGKQVLSELEFVSLYSETPMIAVAGSKGKSSTAALLSHFLQASGKKVATNVTSPLASFLNRTESSDYFVVATNSFQLEGVNAFKPQGIIFLNLTEDHADKYPNHETYLAANREVLKNVDENTLVVFNLHDQQIVSLSQHLKAPALYFSSKPLPEVIDGSWYNRTHIIVKMKENNGPVVFDITEYRLRGTHNRENLMAAILMALKLGVRPETIQAEIPKVRALPHRLQFVRRINSVAFYDDSCAANPAAVLRSLQSFTEPLIMICGGRDKNLDYSILAPHIRQRVKNLILVGDAKEKMNRALGDFTETFLVGTMEEAVLLAYQKSRSGDVILLSPACDSTDQFKDHEDRGEHFHRLVQMISQPRRPNVI